MIAERNSYLILSFDFSQVATARGEDALFRTFFEAVRSGVETLLMAYRERVPELNRIDIRLSTFQDPEALMASLMRIVQVAGHRLYILIDVLIPNVLPLKSANDRRWVGAG